MRPVSSARGGALRGGGHLCRTSCRSPVNHHACEFALEGPVGAVRKQGGAPEPSTEDKEEKRQKAASKEPDSAAEPCPSRLATGRQSLDLFGHCFDPFAALYACRQRG